MEVKKPRMTNFTDPMQPVGEFLRNGPLAQQIERTLEIQEEEEEEEEEEKEEEKEEEEEREKSEEEEESSESESESESKGDDDDKEESENAYEGDVEFEAEPLVEHHYDNGEDNGYPSDWDHDFEDLGGEYKQKKTTRKDPHDYPRPSQIIQAVSEEPVPMSIREVVDELVANLDYYPDFIKTLMQRGFIRKAQNCRKCGKKMSLRRRNNFYEWRCRYNNKKGDCSSSPLKFGSWFENVRNPFEDAYQFIVMHSKRSGFPHMKRELRVRESQMVELTRHAHLLVDRIASRYGKIGENQKVYLEVITLRASTPFGPVYNILAGQEINGTNKCFAKILPDLTRTTFDETVRQNVHETARKILVESMKEDDPCVPWLKPKEFQEADEYPCIRDRIFLNIRNNVPNYIFTTDLAQSWLNDQVCLRNEGLNLMYLMFEELPKIVKERL